jgi:tetratricopeptide (TPR) repeat protein
MFAKTAVSFLPLTLLLVVWWKRARITWRIAWPLLAMFGIATGMGLLTLYVERLHGATGDEFHMGLLERILVSGRSFWFYLGKLFFPYQLIFIYDRWNMDAGLWWQYIYPVGMLVALGGLWFLRARVGRGILVALLHFYITTSMLVLIQVLYMMRYSFVSDHWQYYGCMGVMAATAAGIVGLFRRFGIWVRPLGVAAVAGLVLTLATLSWRQCAVYADTETFWQTIIRLNPNCPMAYYNFGVFYFQRGRLDEAIAQYSKVLQIDPSETDALNNLGSAYLHLGRTDDAIAYYQKALTIKPDSVDAHNHIGHAFLQKGQVDEAVAHYRQALAIKPDSAEAFYNLGNVFLQQGRMDEAIAHYQKALTIKSNCAEAHNNLGNAFIQLGRMTEAVAHYQKAVAIKPDFVDAHNNLGNILLQQGQVKEAIPHYQRALAVKPDDADVQNNLAWALATCPEASLRNGNQAVRLARLANQLTGGNSPVVLHTLAAALAETGQFSEATAIAQRALQLSEAQSNAALADELRFQIKLYQTGKPFHQIEQTPSSHTSP